MESTKKTIDAQVRWMIRRDLPEVLDIERLTFEFAWNEEDFLTTLRQRNCIGHVAEHQNRIVGFMIYELLKYELHVLNFAVAPCSRGVGVGSAMTERMVNKLSQQRRQIISMEIRETNLAAQTFFRHMGFKATRVLRGHYDDTSEDAFRFTYQIKPECHRFANSAK